MNYCTACLLGSLLLVLQQVGEITRTVFAAPYPTSLLVVLVLIWAGEAVLHCVLLLGTLTERCAALTFWLYYGYKLVMLRMFVTFWIVYLAVAPPWLPLLYVTLLWFVWHTAYEYLSDLGGWQGDILVRVDEVAPDAPHWERDVSGPYGWQRMAESNQVLGAIVGFLVELFTCP